MEWLRFQGCSRPYIHHRNRWDGFEPSIWRSTVAKHWRPTRAGISPGGRRRWAASPTQSFAAGPGAHAGTRSQAAGRIS
jgi:hypothetical protein